MLWKIVRMNNLFRDNVVYSQYMLGETDHISRTWPCAQDRDPN